MFSFEHKGKKHKVKGCLLKAYYSFESVRFVFVAASLLRLGIASFSGSSTNYFRLKQNSNKRDRDI